jgi:hypothetical protein
MRTMTLLQFMLISQTLLHHSHALTLNLQAIPHEPYLSITSCPSRLRFSSSLVSQAADGIQQQELLSAVDHASPLALLGQTLAVLAPLEGLTLLLAAQQIGAWPFNLITVLGGYHSASDAERPLGYGVRCSKCESEDAIESGQGQVARGGSVAVLEVFTLLLLLLPLEEFLRKCALRFAS